MLIKYFAKQKETTSLKIYGNTTIDLSKQNTLQLGSPTLELEAKTQKKQKYKSPPM
jgi:hypothetical protein